MTREVIEDFGLGAVLALMLLALVVFGASGPKFIYIDF